MARIPRDEVLWRRNHDGRVRHAVQLVTDTGLLAPVCGGAWDNESWWYDDPTASQCRKCTRLVEPAQEN